MSRSFYLAHRSLGSVCSFSSCDGVIELDVSSVYVGNAFHIKEITTGSYFYPKEDGQGETSKTSRTLKEGEIVCGIFNRPHIMFSFPIG
jgi:hypothetical protein